MEQLLIIPLEPSKNIMTYSYIPTFKTALYLLSLKSLMGATRMRPRVVNGVPDAAQEFPFAVMLQRASPPMIRFCTGSIIDPVWVLTASHCMGDAMPATMRIKYGDTTIPSNETEFFARVLKIVLHPGFRTSSVLAHNDICLLKTERFKNPSIVKLYAVDYKALMGLPVKYAGFGLSERLVKGRKLPLQGHIDPPLLVGEAAVVSCKQDGGQSSGRPAICIAPRCNSGQQPYFGDSGGPLLLNGRLIGVTNGCHIEELPVVGYCPVSPYLEWIYDTMHSDL